MCGECKRIGFTCVHCQWLMLKKENDILKSLLRESISFNRKCPPDCKCGNEEHLQRVFKALDLPY